MRTVEKTISGCETPIGKLVVSVKNAAKEPSHPRICAEFARLVVMTVKNKEPGTGFAQDVQNAPSQAERAAQLVRTGTTRALLATICPFEEKTTMFQKQNGVCAICKKPPTGEEKISSILHVDHRHQTSKTRGLLCIHCNRGLGGFRDNPEYLYAALEYLRAST